MSNLTILGDTSGSVVLQAPAVAGSTTITMPAATGTMMVSGNMPAFNAYATQNSQSISNGSEATVIYQNENFDTASCYNNATGVFTPTVAGYYQISWSVIFYNIITSGEFYSYIMKNGSGSATGLMGWDTVGGTYVYGYSASNIVYANGTTDNFQIRVGQASGSAKTISSGSYFSSCLMRGA